MNATKFHGPLPVSVDLSFRVKQYLCKDCTVPISLSNISLNIVEFYHLSSCSYGGFSCVFILTIPSVCIQFGKNPVASDVTSVENSFHD